MVELLTAIFIIALLISLLLTSLAGVRKQAFASKNAANMRTCYITIVRHADDHGGLMPMPDAVMDPINAVPFEPYDLFWLQLRSYWPSPLPEVDDPAFREALVSPWLENSITEEDLNPPGGRQRLISSTSWLAYGMLHKDEAFTEFVPRNILDEPAMLQHRRLYEIAFPSQKGLLITRWATFGTPYSDDPNHPMRSVLKKEARDTAFDAVFADGSAEPLYPRDSIKPWEVSDPEDRFYIPVLRTPYGLQGVDR